MDTIELNGWQGRLGQGLAPRQLQATLCATNKTMKETARVLGISPATVKQVLDDARFKLSKPPHYIGSVKELVLEAMKRGIISPLILLLCVSLGFGSLTDRPSQRPLRTPKVAVRVHVRQEVA